MITRYAWYLLETARKVWVRVAGFALLALLAAVLARILSPFLPEAFILQTGSEAVAQLLGILTSSMLAVTTFSLSIAVSAFAAAASSATPRASVLLQEDHTTQNVLATFLGAFLFGLVGLIGLRADFYDETGQVVVFLFTIIVVGLIVIALIRWIGHLMEFGRMGDILDRVEQAATFALKRRLEMPYLGGIQLQDAPFEDGTVLTAKQTGYIRHVDMQALQSCCASADANAILRRLPGSFVAPGTPVLSMNLPQLDDDISQSLEEAFTIGANRSFDEDPRFGLIVLTEIALRALSPGVNDPGTAIDIIGRHVRILSEWRIGYDPDVMFDRVHVPEITVQDAIEDAFRPVARDGAALLEVQLRLQKALSTLQNTAPDVFTQSCKAMSQEALDRAVASPLTNQELDILIQASLAER